MSTASTKTRPSSGFTENDVKDTQIFMRTFVDALQCADDIAHKEAARTHYKNQIKIIVQAAHKGRLMLDNRGEVFASDDLPAINLYNLMKFS